MKERRVLGPQIKELREKGYSYRQIMRELNCSPGSVAYHITPGRKERSIKLSTITRRNKPPILKKVKTFFSNHKNSTRILKKRTLSFILLGKVAHFHKGLLVKDYTFLVNDLLKKIGENPTCYLTGRKIDLNKSNEYQLDHIIPRSKGGENTLDNCGLAHRDANQSKRDMLFEDYIKLCIEVLEYQGYNVSKKRGRPKKK